MVPVLHNICGMVNSADSKPMTGKAGQRIGEAGSALLASALLITLITGAGLAAMTSTGVSQNKAKNLIDEKQAFYLAEAGIQHARLVLFSQYIANPNIWTTYSTATPQTLIATTSLSGLGSYKVTIKDASGAGLLMTSTSTASNNATASVSTLVIVGFPNSERAFIAGKDLTLAGDDLVVSGLAGGVQANRDLLITGTTPSIARNATAVRNYTLSGTPTPTPTIGGFAAGGQPRISFNRTTPAQFYSARDYLLNSDGKVYDAKGKSQAMVGGSWNCWTPQAIYTYNAKKRAYVVSSYWWMLTCGTTINGTLYVAGDAVISANVGTQANPWIATIIADGSIKVASTVLNLEMRPPNQSDGGTLYKAKTNNVLFTAGGDILIEGQYDQYYTGIMRAVEQIKITGQPWINGYLVAQDAASSATLVTSNYLGDVDLNHDGTMANGLQGTIQVMSTLY